MLFEGYTDPEQSRLTIDGMMTLGDLGHLDASGRLFVDSREDDMIISGGENVYPGQVEEVLRGHPDVDEAVVMGVDDERFGQRLVAYVVPRPGSDLTGDDVMRFGAREPRPLQGPARGASARTTCRATRSARSLGENCARPVRPEQRRRRLGWRTRRR